jgi:mannose/cellobiose epimerase-like protein (N-acyl-D-glucosamine 2-epimerase family)
VSESSLERLAGAQRRLERILLHSIIPFWYRVVDRESGGYNLNHGVDGNPLGKGPRMVASQAKMLWYFSMLFREGWAGREALEAAEHGFSFLCEKMLDRKHGGFFWEVDAAGRVTRDFKHLYGQAFALFGISEYALASGSREARNLAQELFELLERVAHDENHGGYLELFTRDWKPVDASSPRAKENPVGPAGSKTMNTHLHTMQALSTYLELSKDERAARRLAEIVLVMVDAVVERGSGALVDLHDLAWRPIPVREELRVSYGRNLEALWLVADACRQLRVPPHILTKHFKAVYYYCSKYGFDEKKGGVYDSGPLGKPADKLEKVYLVQAESLVAMLYMYNLYREDRYLRDFERQLDWIEKYQVDWERGEWFEVVLPNGETAGGKAHIRKSAFHNGRAVVKCIKLIDEIIKTIR